MTIDLFSMDTKELLESLNTDNNIALYQLDDDFTTSKSAIDINDDEQFAVTRLTNLAVHTGCKVSDYYNGTMNVYALTKNSMNQFTDALEEDENVYTYNINIVSTHAFTGLTKEVDIESVDLNLFKDSPNVQFAIEVILNPEIVLFAPTYIDVEDFYDEDDVYSISESKNTDIFIKTKYNKELLELHNVTLDCNMNEDVYLAFDVNDSQIYELIRENDTVIAESHVLNEIKRKIKVNFRGIKRIKMQCSKGFKYDSERKTCVKITGGDMATMRKAHIKMARTKKSLGTSYKIRVLKKTRKAERFRKVMGLK
ncbi:MAG: hypothetical protein RSC93_00865 [Erysipelotrichaceae bacterium]